jgi:hypothetical protein
MKPTEPVPPQASHGDALGRLQRELWHARDTGETRRVQDLTRRIGRLRAELGQAEPQRETTMASPPQRETAAAKPAAKPKPARKATARKSTARKQTPRSPRVPRQ